ncbi:MAG: VTT domain-containing protein [Gammaproteobacteria bacterium]|nr:VTT domain-containing protein [Gammaproteobacteria bacterium]
MLQECISFFLTIDQHLLTFVSSYGSWAYLLLFLIIFCETGLVVTPFLPGDSLLFVAGNLAAQTHVMQVNLLFLLLVVASFLGNQLNYQIGHFLGPRVFRFQQSWLLNQRHLREAHAFYEKYGKTTIILARFLPIIRTFAPFVAGIAKMDIRIFTLYNLLSACIWIGSVLFAGYYLGHFAYVQAHFIVLIYGIVVISLLPSLWIWVRSSLCCRKSIDGAR